MHADDLCVCHEALSDLITLPLPRHALPTSLVHLCSHALRLPIPDAPLGIFQLEVILSSSGHRSHCLWTLLGHLLLSMLFKLMSSHANLSVLKNLSFWRNNLYLYDLIYSGCINQMALHKMRTQWVSVK